MTEVELNEVFWDWLTEYDFDKDPDFRLNFSPKYPLNTVIIVMRFKNLVHEHMINKDEITKPQLIKVLDRMVDTLKDEVLKQRHKQDLRHIFGRSEDIIKLDRWVWNTSQDHRSIKKDSQFTRIIVARKNNKDVTVIFWDDGTKTKLVRENDDFFSVTKAVAIGHMIKRYGSNSAYKVYIRKAVGHYPNAYDTVAMYEASKIYGGNIEFHKQIDEKLEYGQGYSEED